MSGSGHHSFHWLIAFLVSCEVLFTIAAYFSSTGFAADFVRTDLIPHDFKMLGYAL